MRTSPARAALLGCTALLALLGGCDAADPSAGEPALTSLPAEAARTNDVLPGRYVVVLRDEPASRTGGHLAPQARAALDQLVATPGVAARHTYTHALVGFSAELTDEAAAALRRDSRVKAVVPDALVTAYETQSSAPWGLDRIDQRALPLSTTYTYEGTGEGVTAYVIDSGVRITHAEFGGRASHGWDFVEADADASDCSGHGTHVAGTLGGATYGVAKGVSIVSVRVLDCAGQGTTSGVIAGVDWVTANGDGPAVVNMSLGTSGTAINAAVQGSVAAGFTYVVAAGNSSDDACRYTPASTPEAITVGATRDNDQMAYFSNQGRCLDLFAPGMNIRSAVLDGDTESGIKNGTSMAAPHVAGAAALYLAHHPAASAAEVSAAVVTAATAGAVSALKGNTPNRLLYALPLGTPPGNAAPTAAFAPSCSGLTCTFTDQSTDPDGGIVSWSWAFGDGTTSTAGGSTSHTYASAGSYTVTLTVTDGAGATATTSRSVSATDGGPGGGLTLTVTGRPSGAWAYADLTWSPADGGTVVVTRSGPIAGTFTTADDGSHSDKIGRSVSGTYTYRVCESGTTNCSNEAAVTF